MEKVTIEINARWGRLVRSPVMLVIAALQGISITMAPLFLYWSGKGEFYPQNSQWLVPLLFAIVYLVPLFYFFIGGPVVKALRART